MKIEWLGEKARRKPWHEDVFMGDFPLGIVDIGNQVITLPFVPLHVWDGKQWQAAGDCWWEAVG